MDDHHIAQSRFVVLIGINAYPSKPLKGCVPDIHSIKHYLDSVQCPIDVQMFTATENTSSGSCQVEDPKLWPTYENVTSALRRVTALATSRDCVYIHYSGHGTRELCDQTPGDLALVLLDGNQETYLWTSELAVMLKAMVDKGVVLTLVLDCCFSASMSRRSDSEVRFLPYNAEICPRHSADHETNLANDTANVTSRDIHMYPSWLINPDRYAVLAACGPHEEAIEPRFNGQKHGALSYFLLDALKTYGLSQNHKYLHDYIRSKFRKARIPQNPVLYGVKNQSFFGQDDRENDFGVVSIIISQDHKIELQAGMAHGVAEGDKFVLSSVVYTKLDAKSLDASLVAKVSCVRSLTAELQLPEASTEPRTGWMATSLSKLSLSKYSVQFDESLPYRQEWLVALKTRMPHIDLRTDQHPSTFHVRYNSNGKYEILDASKRQIPHLPSVALRQPDFDQLGDLIQHLARHSLVRDIVNTTVNNDFQRSFEIRMVARSNEVFTAGSTIEVEQDERAKSRIELQIENKGEKPLYVNVYNIGPRFEVQNILRESHKVVIPKGVKGSRGMWTQRLKPSIPVALIEEGYHQCEDIIKVFVTSQATSFDLFELPELGNIPSRKAVRGFSRGVDRASEDWMAAKFIVRTSVK